MYKSLKDSNFHYLYPAASPITDIKMCVRYKINLKIIENLLNQH